MMVLSSATKGVSDHPTPTDVSLRALADPTRRRILLLVRDNERAAGEIAAHFTTISRPAVSQHLAVLEGAALVTARRDGTRRLYRARPEGLDDAWAFIEEMWHGALHRLKAAAEQAERAAAHPNPIEEDQQ